MATRAEAWSAGGTKRAHAPPPPRRPPPLRSRYEWLSNLLLPLAFAAVVSSFVVSNIVVQRSSADVGHDAEEIVRNTAPSIETLARVRRHVLECELALWHLVHAPEQGDANAELDAALAAAEQELRAYLELDVGPGERQLLLAMQEAWVDFEKSVERARELVAEGRVEGARAAFSKNVEPARRRVLDVATRVIEHNAIAGRGLAEEIRETRRDAARLAKALNAVCVVLAAAVGYLLYRQAAVRRALSDAHSSDLETRAAELEAFAGRVAHDIRNPLTSARLAAQIIERRDAEPAVREASERITRSLSRAEAITSALLDFARSGAKPDPGARTDTRSVVEEVVAELSPEARRQGIEVRVEAAPDVLVAASTGVYLSLLGNLVRNAIKYMGSAPVRRIVVRVVDEGGTVRTEVTDTGPGIPADKLAKLFAPYFRAQSGPEGLGLGLATVKRLVEAHGGDLGVRSEVGAGSTFWFSLPKG